MSKKTHYDESRLMPFGTEPKIGDLVVCLNSKTNEPVDNDDDKHKPSKLDRVSPDGRGFHYSTDGRLWAPELFATKCGAFYNRILLRYPVKDESKYEPRGTVPVVGDVVEKIEKNVIGVAAGTTGTVESLSNLGYAITDADAPCLLGGRWEPCLEQFQDGRARVLKRKKAEPETPVKINTMAELFAHWRDNPDAEFLSAKQSYIFRTRDGFPELRPASGSEFETRCVLYSSDFPMTLVTAKPLRDVFKDPRKKDVVQTYNGTFTLTVKTVDGELVAGQWNDGSYLCMTRKEWEELPRDLCTVKHRAEEAHGG